MNKQIADIDPIDIDIDFDSVITNDPIQPEAAPVAKEEEVVEDIVEPVIEPKAKEPVEPVVEPVEPVVEEEEEVPTIASEILEALGYTEDFKDEEFEDSTEGLAKLTKLTGDKIASDTLDRIFNAHPTVKAHLDFVQNGGDPNKFMQSYSPKKDYASIKLEGDSDETKEIAKSVLRDYFTARGDSPEFANDIIESYEDKGLLVSKGAAAGTALANSQAAAQAKVIEDQRRQAEAQRIEDEKTWAQVTDIVTKAPTIGGIPIATRERASFQDYISKPVDARGRTQRDLDLESATLEQQLGLDFLMFKKLDMNTIIKTRAKTESAISLRERLAAKEAKPKSTRRQHSNPASEVVEDLDLDAI